MEWIELVGREDKGKGDRTTNSGVCAHLWCAVRLGFVLHQLVLWCVQSVTR